MGTSPVQEPSPAQETVSWGPSTYAGYGVAATAFVLALLAFVGGDHSEQTIGVLVPGVIGGLSFAITQIGRYVQANSKIKAAKSAQVVAGALGSVPQADVAAALERLTSLLEAQQQPLTTVAGVGGENAPAAGAITQGEWTGTAPVQVTSAESAPRVLPPEPDVDNSVLSRQVGDADAETGPPIPDEVPTEQEVAAALSNDDDLEGQA